MEHAPPFVWGAVVRLPKIESDPDVEIRLISPAEQEALFQTFLHVQAPLELAASAAAGGGMRPPRANTPAAPVPDQEIERLLLLSLIRIHLSRASTDTLEVLERDLQTAPRTGA
jgi:hypothetical protein